MSSKDDLNTGAAGAKIYVDPASKPEADTRVGELRKAGWSVAVHNDYRQDGESKTFWLFTRGSQCAKGEGRTDSEAIDEVEQAIGDLAKPADLDAMAEKLIDFFGAALYDDEQRAALLAILEGD